MSRVIVTSACVLPASGGQPALSIGKGAVLEVTAAMAAAIAAAGGTTRSVTAMSATAAHDQLGEAVGVSNGD
jgi:hypothetical protein